MNQISIDSVKEFAQRNPFSVVKGDFMNFNYTFPEKNRLYWEIIKYFAYEGMKRIGVKEQYECGII